MAASNTRFTQNSLGQSKNPIDSDHGIYRYTAASSLGAAGFARQSAPPRDHHQRDDAEKRGGHQVIGRRQRIAGLRDQPSRRKRGESAEDCYR